MNTNKIRYNYEFLQDFCKSNNITLLKDYSNEKVNISPLKCSFSNLPDQQKKK